MKIQKLKKVGRECRWQKILGIMGVKNRSHILKLEKGAKESYCHFDWDGGVFGKKVKVSMTHAF